MEVIRGKAARTPPAGRSAITLVLDAQKCILFELPPVHIAFHRFYFTEASALGFEDILLVGPSRVIALLSPEQPDGTWLRISGNATG